MKKQIEMTVERHAEMASRILASLHAIAVSGKLDLTDGEKWDYDWALLDALMRIVPTMKTTGVCESGTSYDGCWTHQQVDMDVHCFGTDYRGTLVVSRSGPGLDEVWWSFTEEQPEPLPA